MVKNKIKKGEKVANTKCTIEYYNEKHFVKKVTIMEEEEVDYTHTTLSVKIDQAGGTDKHNYMKVTCPTIADWEEVENTLATLKCVDEELMDKRATGIMSEDVTTKWTYVENLCKSPAAKNVLKEATKAARSVIASTYRHLTPNKVKDQSWGLSDDQYRSFIINPRQFHEWLAKRDQAKDVEQEYFGKQALTKEEYLNSLWTNYDNRIMNELHKTIFGEKAYKALEEQKSYLTNCIVKPFGTSISLNFQRVDTLTGYLTYYPPTTERERLPTDAQWATHKARYAGAITSEMNRRIKFNLLPTEFQSKLEDPSVKDWLAMKYHEFNDYCKYLEREDTKAREIRESQKEKMKDKNSKSDEKHGSDMTSRIPRRDREKNKRNKRDRESYEERNESRGRAKYCEYCNLMGKPDYVCKTHNARDCKNKSYYQRKLAGGPGGSETVKRDYRKEMRVAKKKYQAAQDALRDMENDAREMRSTNKRQRNENDARYTTDPDDDDISVRSNGTNVES